MTIIEFDNSVTGPNDKRPLSENLPSLRPTVEHFEIQQVPDDSESLGTKALRSMTTLWGSSHSDSTPGPKKSKFDFYCISNLHSILTSEEK